MKFKQVFAIFHKYHDGDFVCYGPDGAFFGTLGEAKREFPSYDRDRDEGKACIMPVWRPE